MPIVKKKAAAKPKAEGEPAKAPAKKAAPRKRAPKPSGEKEPPKKAARKEPSRGTKTEIISYVLQDRVEEATEWCNGKDLSSDPLFADLHYMAFMNDKPWAVTLFLRSGLSCGTLIPGMDRSLDVIIQDSESHEMLQAMQAAT